MPWRGVGGFMIAGWMGAACLSACGVFVAWKYPEKNDLGDWLLVFGLLMAVATLVLLLPGLYLTTRWRSTRLDARGVTMSKGWCFGRSTQRRPLSAYRGLMRYSREFAADDVGTWVGATIGGVLGAIFGGGAIAMNTVAFHFVLLKHRTDDSLDVPLVCDPDESIAKRTLHRIARRFSLNVLDPAGDDFVVRTPSALDRSIVDRPGDREEGLVSAENAEDAEEPIDFVEVTRDDPVVIPDMTFRAPVASSATAAGTASPPKGVNVHHRGAETTITYPENRAISAGGFGIAVFMLGAASSSLFIPPTSSAAKGGTVLLACLGMLALIGGVIAWFQRSRVVLGSGGLAIRSAGIARESIYVAWRDIRHVAAAREGNSGKMALMLSTAATDYWLSVGARTDVIEWLSRAILSKAAAVSKDDVKRPP